MQGDYTQRIAVTSADEVGRLAASFNEMTEGLQASTRNLNEEHARLQASINSLDIGFLMISKQAEIVSCNPAMLEILDLDAAAKQGLTLEQVQKRIQDYDLVSAIKACLQDGRAFSAREVSYGRRFLSVIGAPIRLERGEIIGSVMVVEDITEAKILARSRDEFFSIASHELRTPLTAIKGNTSMIADYYPEILKDQAVKDMLGDIHESSVRLIDIVNDFLDVSRIEQGKMVFKFEPFAIESVIQSVVTEMKPMLKEKKLYLNFDKAMAAGLPLVWADTNRVKQIVYNLVGNAAKFTEGGGITINAGVEKGMVHIYVVDTGRGIPLDKQELLFRKFQQAGSSLLTRDTTRGTGLGLYISKMLAERMEGNIALVKSEEGKGTTFSFSMPMATKAQLAKKD
jgi:PAS domain S-box-containing protein